MPNKPEMTTQLNKNYVTPLGLEALKNEFQHLRYGERPKVVDVVRWAAGNGDRSENGDYIYGKKRLREIDRRVRYLTKQIANAVVVDPQQQKHLTKAFFGAVITYINEEGTQQTVQLVGVDEADLTKGKISWNSPVAKALLKSEVGDTVTVHTPKKKEKLKVIEIRY